MKIKSKLRFLSKLTRLFDRRERWQFAGVMTAALAMALFQALGVASIIPFISLVMRPEIVLENQILSRIYGLLGFETVRSFMLFAGIVMLAIIVIGNLVFMVTIWLKTRFVYRKNHRLSSDLLKKYLSMPYSYFLNRNTADLSKNILSEVGSLTTGFLMQIMEIIIDIIIILLIFLTLILISPLATATIFLIFCIFYGFIYKSKFRGRLKKKGNRRLKENQGRFQAASEALGGIKDIKLMGREGYFISKFKGHSLKMSDLLSWNAVVGQIPKYFIEIIAFGGVIAFILLLIITERDIASIIPMVSFFAFAGYRIMPTMNRMFVAFTKIQFNRAILDRVYTDMTEETYETKDFKTAEEKKNIMRFEKSIEFKNLSFAYPGMNEYVLKDINMQIDKGHSVAVVGPTGTGKTTFVDIALGLLTPSEGKIEVDGIEITHKNLRSWQRNLGYVPQFIYLTDNTLKRNIAFGIPDEEIDMEKIEKVAEAANLSDFIKTLPKGYNTVVGERGVRLSGGQRQRVGIARALYGDPQVLVLDEATSSLDGITEESVLKAIENISKLKTTITIAHRLTTVKKCDIIHLIEDGKITDSGRYNELLERNAQFRAMAGEK